MLSLCAAAASSPAMLSAGRNIGEASLWGSVRPRARPVALWELKLFFKAEDDMQRQLGLRGQKDQDDTFGLIAGIAVAGVVTSSVIEASSLPPVAKLPLGAVCSLAPFLALAAGVAVPQASPLPPDLPPLSSSLPPLDSSLQYRRSPLLHPTSLLSPAAYSSSLPPFTPSLAAPRPCRRR